MAKQKTVFSCQECGFTTYKWFGKCPSCSNWNTLVEEMVQSTPKNSKININLQNNNAKPILIKEIEIEDFPRFSTGSSEVNRVLGGGVVPGSLVLIVGDPGVGKSSLTLKISAKISERKKVLYVSGEESQRQIRMRGDRLLATEGNLYILSETNMDRIEHFINEEKPEFVIIDSIQTIYKPEIQSAPGSISQVREASVNLMRIAKENNITIFIIGHVTKDGTLAGPRALEHIVDTVLYFEGERHQEFRILRAVKNRFGNTNEIGIFEMSDTGLIDVPDASKTFLSDEDIKTSGTVIVPALEGTRPILVEIQALVAQTPYVPPRRTSDSIDIKKIQLILAVLEKRVNLHMGMCDVYVKVPGGMKVDDPGIDLGLACAMVSSFKNVEIPKNTIFLGEIGLSGEIRSVSHIDIRIKEAIRMGFKKIIIPKKNMQKLHIENKDIKIYGYNYLHEIVKFIL